MQTFPFQRVLPFADSCWNESILLNCIIFDLNSNSKRAVTHMVKSYQSVTEYNMNDS